MKVHLSPRAARDVDEIWNYTAEHWGRQQANDYVADLRAAAEGLVQTHARSADASDILPGLRKIRSNAHVLYFRVDQNVEVIRVLHVRRDAGTALTT